MILSSLLLVALASDPAPVTVPLHWPRGWNCPRASVAVNGARSVTDGFLSSDDRELPFPAKQPMNVDKPQALTQLRFQPTMVGFSWVALCLSESPSRIIWECSKDECHFVAHVGLSTEFDDRKILNEDTLQLAQSAKSLKADVGEEVALRFALAASIGEMRDLVETGCRPFKCRKTLTGWDDALNLALVRKGHWKRGGIGRVKGQEAGRVEFDLGEKLSATLECSYADRHLVCATTVRRGREELRLEQDQAAMTDMTLLLAEGPLHLLNGNEVEIGQAQLELQ